MEKACRVYSTSIKQLKKVGDDKLLVDKFNAANFDDLLIQIGSGKTEIKTIIENIPSLKNIVEKEEEKTKLSELDTFSTKIKKSSRSKSKMDNAVIVDGLDDLMVRMAKCCNPIPGDPIFGYVTRGRGITVHTQNCNRAKESELDRGVNVEWNPNLSIKYPVTIRVITLDKPGILSLISNQITNQGINIRSAMAKSLPDGKGSFIFEIEVGDYSELLKSIHNIESLEEVISVQRA